MLIQQRGVERVALVVVVADGVAVPVGAVLPPERTASSPRRHGTTPDSPAAAPSAAQRSRSRPGPPGRPAADQRPDPRQPFGQVALGVDARRRRTHGRGPARSGPTATGAPPRANAGTTTGRAAGPASLPSHAADPEGERAEHLAHHAGDPGGNGAAGEGVCARRAPVVERRSSGLRIPTASRMPPPGGAHRHGVCSRCSPQDRRSSHVRVRSKVPEFRATRAGGRFDQRALSARPSPRAPCAGAFLVSGPPRSAVCTGRWSPDRREEAHAHAGEGRGDRRDHRAVPELQCGRAHRVPRADRGPADPAAPFPRCGQQLRRRQEHPDEAGGGLGRILRPRTAAERPHRDRLHRG